MKALRTCDWRKVGVTVLEAGTLILLFWHYGWIVPGTIGAMAAFDCLRYHLRHSGPAAEGENDELLAIASLIEAHRDEFDAHISGIEQRRAWLERKATAVKRKKAPWE